MVPVTIADVLMPHQGAHAVVLFDEAGRRILTIRMGHVEGQAIAMGLREFELPRPLTHTFAARVLEAVGGRLEEDCVAVDRSAFRPRHIHLRLPADQRQPGTANQLG